LKSCATNRKVAGSIPEAEFDSAPNRNEYQRSSLGSKGGRCVRLTTLQPSCADCLEILGASVSWSPEGPSGPVQGTALKTINHLKMEEETVTKRRMEYNQHTSDTDSA
jgi:hypothetical protein